MLVIGLQHSVRALAKIARNVRPSRDLVVRFDVAAFEVVEILVAHLTLEVLRWVVADNFYESPDVELPESLGHSDFDLFTPDLALWWLALLSVVRDLENEKLLVQKEELSEPLEIDQ